MFLYEVGDTIKVSEPFQMPPAHVLRHLRERGDESRAWTGVITGRWERPDGNLYRVVFDLSGWSWEVPERLMTKEEE